MHPTVKPVALVADALRDCSRRGEVVLEGFGGSGSTLIAAEKTGRDVGSYVLFMVIADETDEAARAKWEHYKAGADDEALKARISEIWQQRSDRYSQIRCDATVKPRKKIEMSYIGG